MGKVTINRDNSYIGCLAKYNLYIDDQLVGQLANGQSIELILSNGDHTLHAKNVLDKRHCSNVLTLHISDATEIRVRCSVAFSNIAGMKLTIESQKNNSAQSNMDKYELLEKLNNLKNKNIISEQEYEEEKQKILGRS